ncbi:uncharacterized protein LOC123299159 [Chrysoperla carnea]|uniref:uncharacterized protein LOC123299159 n=1 Tax=Chrysoperla carnea TaxID=189513 RepID=UPI001D06320C|nr:uncharacterized protein LOC123299159 [Chrysoperla carnea]
MLKYMLYFCLEKLQIKLKTLQKYTADILITPDDVQDLAISFNVPTEAHFKTLRLISQSNIIDIKHYPLPRQGLTIRQIYNFPGVTVKCQFTDIVFSRTNLSSYKSSVTLSSRKNPVVVNKKLIGDKKLKQLEENEKDVALSTKYLMNYFQSVFGAFQQGEITGVKYLRDVCTEFVKDIVYISPSRKAMVMNSEFHCSLSNYAYVVAPNINVNRICLKHVINPEVKILLSEPDTPDQCYLKLICNLCNIDYDAFDSEQTIKNFSKHLVRVHGYFAEAHTCVYCNKDFSFQELLNKRWMHECYS